jgi:hypothetical protein
LLSAAKIKVQTSDALEQRTAELTQFGFTFYDAAHVASADRLIRKAIQLTDQLKVKIENPVQWLSKKTQQEDANDEDTK